MDSKIRIAKVDYRDIVAEEYPFFTAEQFKILLERTPLKYVKKRPAKGGGEWDYVEVAYIEKQLNRLFNWNWDFFIDGERIEGKMVIVKGRLVCRTTSGITITKMQYGRKDVMYKKDGSEPLDLGNDFKSACSDALKKCASLLGIASDVYGKSEFRDIEIVDSGEVNEEDLRSLFDAKKEVLTDEERYGIERILNNKEVRSYRKVKMLLMGK